MKDLAQRFGIAVGLVSRYIATWICFLYQQCATDLKIISQLEGQNEEQYIALQCAQAETETLKKEVHVEKLSTSGVGRNVELVGHYRGTLLKAVYRGT